jgi:hypothetical protein
VFSNRRGPFPQGELMFAYETSGCLNRNCCGARRSLKIRIDTGAGAGAPALTLERPLRCGSWPCCCKLQEMHVFTGAGGKHDGLLVSDIVYQLFAVCSAGPRIDIAVLVHA